MKGNKLDVNTGTPVETKFANSEHRTEQETFLWSTFFGGWGGVGDMPCSMWGFSSPTRDQTHTPLHWILGRGNFHWTAKEVPHMEHLNYVFAMRQEAFLSFKSMSTQQLEASVSNF